LKVTETCQTENIEAEARVVARIFYNHIKNMNDKTKRIFQNKVKEYLSYLEQQNENYK